MSTSIGQIIREAKRTNPNCNEKMIRTAHTLAEQAHRGQQRQSGEPFIIHPRTVAFTLASLGLDTATVAAGLLHDTIEDTELTRADIARELNDDIAWLCQSVTKLEHFHPNTNTGDHPRESAYTENLRKFFLAMAEDIRVVLIKLADRLHNMETLRHLPEKKRCRIAQETMDIYAPIAERLGIWNIKGKLEDLAFPHLEPDAYQWTKRRLASRIKRREMYLSAVTPKLKRVLKKEGIDPIEIQSRAKTYWSCYQKLQRNDMDDQRLHDLVAMRIIVNNIEECYAALGIVHALWRPVPNHIKDYIAIPKPNGYQSLHTTVFADDGEMIEIQIRSSEMHDDAEHGIAAHWAYVEAGKPRRGTRADKQRLEWIRQLREWQNEIEGSEEFLQSLKIDFFEQRIFVFTPRGDVIDLPRGASAIDFGYHIHSDIGNHCAGARVNGKMTALDEPLDNGAIVEIITRDGAHPNRDWLDIVQTTSAKSHIRRYLREARSSSGDDEDPSLPSDDTAVLNTKIPGIKLPRFRESKTKRMHQRSNTILIDGAADINVHRARCCNPLPGHEIRGYITKRGTVSVHRVTCPNLRRHDTSRQIDAVWDAEAMHDYTIRLTVEDRVGMLKQITSVISEAGLNISDIHTRPHNSAFACIDITLPVTDADLLKPMLRNLRALGGVVDIVTG